MRSSKIIVIALSISLYAQLASAETIQVLVKNAKNGQPVPNEKLSIQLYGERDAREYVTDKNGIAVIEIKPTDRIWAATEWWITCKKLANSPAQPSDYVLANDVLREGVTLSNTCGREKSEPIRGKLIIFARKASLIENLKR